MRMKRLSFRTNEVVDEKIRALYQTGLYGRTLSETIDRLICAQLQNPSKLELQSQPVCPELWLLNHGYQKINVIKCIREFTGLGLKEAKDLSEAYPCRIHVAEASIQSFYNRLCEYGATVEIRK